MKQHEKYWQGTNVVTDIGWGDAGKGKLVDLGAQYADMVIRYSGGGNAGHTIRNHLGEFKNHLIPSGIFNPKTICVIGGGVVIDLAILVKEIEELRTKGVTVTPQNLRISDASHLVMPWHKFRDGLREKSRSGGKIGTTGQGIGPTYSDRTAREGIRICDLLRRDFTKIFDETLHYQKQLLTVLDGESHQLLNRDEILKELLKMRKIIAPFVVCVLPIIREYHERGKNVLAEGAQGALLDLDLGGYPYVTSSNPGVVGFIKTTGIPAKEISKVIGTTRAYTARVGSGPMPTELFDKIGEHIQQKGREFGTTTGRKRRCGWLDIPAMKQGIIIAGADSIALTKLDVLDELPKIKICVAYKVGGKQYVDLPTVDARFMEKAKPVFITVPGWTSNTSVARKFDTLPKEAQKYIKTVERLLEKPIDIVSVAPEREATIFL